MKDFCLNFIKMVNKSCLIQQITEKIAVKVDTKFVFGKSVKIGKYLYLMRMLKAFLINHHPEKPHDLI